MVYPNEMRRCAPMAVGASAVWLVPRPESPGALAEEITDEAADEESGESVDVVPACDDVVPVRDDEARERRRGATPSGPALATGDSV